MQHGENNVCIPFFNTDQMYSSLSSCLFDGLDYGDIVEYDGSNAPEYEALMGKVMK